MTRSKKLMVGALSFVALVVGARLVAPYYVLKYVNKTLDGLDGYAGHVDDVDLHIWRGAYEIEGVRIVKDGPGQKTPLIKVARADISVDWPALLDGSIVGEIDLYSPVLNYVAEKQKDSAAENAREEREAKKAVHGESSWQTQVKELVPLKINHIGVIDGEIHYRDIHQEPQVDVYMRNFRGRVSNLTNSTDLSNDMVATASFRGLVMGSGKFRLDGKIDPYAEKPTFAMDVRLEDLEIEQLNDFLKAYANVDAERGTLSVYTEFDAQNGRFEGYVKPLIRDLRIIKWKQEEEGVLGKLWESLVEVGTELFENHPKEQVATKIPMSGKLEEPDADVYSTVIYVLRNAFVEALRRGLDRSVDVGGEKTAEKSTGGDEQHADEKQAKRNERSSSEMTASRGHEND